MSTTRTVNRRTAAAAIADRAPFRNSGGTFHGRPADAADAFLYMGRLPAEHAETLRAALTDGSADYVVFSYGTPIGWAGSAGTVVPDVKHSPTTSGHQGITRTAFSAPADYIEWSRSAR